jgi:adenosylmethionine-8-amino-7-oxononanoate aminotransferase
MDTPHLWLPYCQMKTAPEPLQVVGTEGVQLKLADGRELIDGIASWWTSCHGYNHPHITRAIAEQAATIPHVMFGGMIHAPAQTLAARLVKLTEPLGMARVFFVDSGSVAVELALKMAIQYWRNRGQSAKSKFLSFSHGYHGDTLGAMSVSDPNQNMHGAFKHYMFRQLCVDIPHDEYGFEELDTLLKDFSNQLAAIIIEPLVQGAGGMKFHSPDVLAEIRRLAKKHNILFIADEIATGFGRTGHMFACEEAAIQPDILCLGKALTGGAISMAATLASAEVFDAFWSDDTSHALMHGPTYMANPLACAAANASLDLFEQEPRLKQVEAIEAQLHTELTPLRALPNVVDVRVKGAVGVVQLTALDRTALRQQFIEHGCWIRPLEDVIYLTPAFTITNSELGKLTTAIVEICQNQNSQ